MKAKTNKSKNQVAQQNYWSLPRKKNVSFDEALMNLGAHIKP